MAEEEFADFNENPIVFYTSPGALMEISSSKLALLCWHQQLLRVYPDYAETIGSVWFIKHEFSSSDILQIPCSIRKFLDYQIQRIGKELERWLGRMDSYFSCDRYKYFLICMEYVVLDPNGLICWKTTARNLLASGKFDSMNEYWLACAHCFQDDIERLWPSVSKDIDVTDDDFSDYPASLCYWTCRMRNELHKVPGNPQDSVEFRIMSLETLHRWPEIEYFWNRITPAEQISQLEFILKECSVAKYLLPKLNRTQLQHALKDDSVPAAILYDLAKNQIHSELVLHVWSYVKDSLTENQFFHVLDNLLKLAFYDPSEYRILTEHVAVLLYHVWSSAPDGLRNEILNRRIEWFFYELTPLDENDNMRWFGRDMRFHLDLWINIGFNLRRRIWLEKWRDLIMIAKVADLDQFMKLCFANETDIVVFKAKKMINYKDKVLRKHFGSFIKMALTDELIEYLKFCCPDEDRVRNLMKRIIDSNVPEMHKLKFNALVKFNDFIVRSFPSPELANQYEEKLIRERSESWYELLDKSCLNGVKNIFQCYLSSKPNLLYEAKRRCYERCQHILRTAIFVEFDIQEWQTFLKWCAPNEEELAKFKKSLPIDDIFNILLSKAIKGENASSYEAQKWYASFKRHFADMFPYPDVVASLVPLSHFLLWYFESGEATKIFKMSKINNYQQVDVINDLFKKKDGLTIGCILNWFFDHDQQRRNEFLTTISGLFEVDSDESTDEEMDESDLEAVE